MFDSCQVAPLLDPSKLTKYSICLTINTTPFSKVQVESSDLKTQDVDLGKLPIGQIKVFRVGQTRFAIEQSSAVDLQIVTPDPLFIYFITPFLGTIDISGDTVWRCTKFTTEDKKRNEILQKTKNFFERPPDPSEISEAAYNVWRQICRELSLPSPPPRVVKSPLG